MRYLPTKDPDIRSLNRQRMGAKAGAMLHEVGESPDENCLYLVQLAIWGIEHAGLETESVVVETIRAMSEWTSSRSLNLFQPEEGCEISLDGWEGAATPRDLAEIIVRGIEERVFRTFPVYLAAD